MYHGDANERQRSELHMVRKDNISDKSLISQWPVWEFQRRLWIGPAHIGIQGGNGSVAVGGDQ